MGLSTVLITLSLVNRLNSSLKKHRNGHSFVGNHKWDGVRP